MKNILAYIPFTSPWIIRHFLGDEKKVLDVGCGDGSLMVKVNCDRKYDVVGIDLYKPYLKIARESGVYKKIIVSDIRKLKFKNNSFDAVLLSQVIEHLNKKEALKVISTMEKIAKDKVIICTTNGFAPYDPFDVFDDNSLQVHKSGWEIKEMKNYGYKVYGQGAGFIYKPGGLLLRFRKLKSFLVMLSFLFSPLNYFFPRLSAFIVAVRSHNDSET